MNPTLWKLQAWKIIRSLSHPLGRKLLRLGVIPAWEHVALLTELGIRSCVDVGANKGQFVAAVVLANPAATVVAFEPLPEPYQRLSTMADWLGERIIVHNLGLGERTDAEATINVSNRPDSSSLLPISALQSSLFPGTGRVGTASVQIEALDSLDVAEVAPPRALLKIDVQGYEAQVLAGAHATLNLFDFVYVESSLEEFYVGQPLSHEIIGYLSDRGFYLHSLLNPTIFDRRVVQADFLFTRHSSGH